MRIKVRKVFPEYKRYNPGPCDYIVTRLDEKDYAKDYKDHHIIVAYSNVVHPKTGEVREIVLGWALLYLKKHRKTWEYMVYVRPKYRMMGVGKKLFCKATKLVDYITVYPWDKRSANYFKSVLKKCPIKWRVEFFGVDGAREWRK